MNKTNVHASAVMNPPRIESDASILVATRGRSRHLIVLIPPDSDCSNVTRRICKLAVETNSDIQLLGLCKDATQELALRRQLVTVSALIRNAKASVETKIETGMSWLDTVKRQYQDGDIIVCITDPSTGFRQRPLSQILESTFKAPIYVLSETASAPSRSNILSQIVAWSGLVGIIGGFFILQVRLSQLPKDWFQTLLFILLLIPEFGLIWFWNYLFS